MKKYVLSIPDAMSDRIEKAHKQGKLSASFPSQFIKHLITIGLEEYQAQEKRRDTQPKTRLQAASCETAPEAIQHTETKIIPFPGASLPEPDDDVFQTQLDGFLREIGYIE
jgi:hypothetical protein